MFREWTKARGICAWAFRVPIVHDWQEDLVLRLAQAFEQATDWHRQSAELDVT